MRRVGRILRNALTVLSLLLFAATVALEEATAEFRTCPACGRERAGVVIVMDVFDPEWAK